MSCYVLGRPATDLPEVSLPPLPDKPGLALLLDPFEGETAVGAWIEWMSLGPSTVTRASRDGGVDVVSKHVVVQVKMEMVKASRPDLQRLTGVAACEGKRALFFALHGFTADALQWGQLAGMALFSFNRGGEPEPKNATARSVWEAAHTPSRHEARSRLVRDAGWPPTAAGGHH
ncbi:MAG: restriction endonuclease [Sporichthyaceae bacterium]